ncbi:MAG: tripartite tricarboxylate transporter permease [Castellaniella sp.]
MTELIDAFVLISTPSVFFSLIIGVIGGILVGAAPGLSSTIAIGLLIPFTYGLSKYIAFALLLGIYCGSMFGGAIPAVLMNLPGTPSSAVTAIDGYPMAQKGRGGHALTITVLSATVGGLISCLFLIFLAPQLAFVAIAFGPPEYFSLSVFALVVVFSMTGSSILKGIIATGIGLLLSTIGIDPIAPASRFTFDSAVLAIGIPVVPATIALFCVAEALRLIFLPPRTEGSSVSEQIECNFTMLFEYGRKLWRTLIPSGLIGTVIGILPGTGAMMAGLMSYGVAKKYSKTQDTFGQGNPEGVAASQAAESAVTGGALIPMLTLGIPGDTNTLMLLGAMLVLGLVPGPSLFTNETTLIYLIFIVMVMAYILILFIGLRIAPLVAKMTQVDKRYLVPIVLILAITGPAVSEGHIYYYWLAIVFGIIGLIFQISGFPVIGMAMGLVLGPIIEENLRGALMRPEPIPYIFFGRPFSALFLLLAIFLILTGLYRNIKNARSYIRKMD